MAATNKNQEKSFYALALARIGLGLIFLWAFFDKLFGFGFATCRDAVTNAVETGCSRAWIEGGSPTSGYLNNATQGPLGDTFKNLAGQGWVDWLFMLGLLAVGVGLLLGIAVKLSAIAGSLMMLLMWASALWPANNPILDDHIIYLFVLAAIYYSNSNQKWGLGAWWAKLQLVKKVPILK